MNNNDNNYTILTIIFNCFMIKAIIKTKIYIISKINKNK